MTSHMERWLISKALEEAMALATQIHAGGIKGGGKAWWEGRVSGGY